MASSVTRNEAVPPGTVLLGKYRVESILGQGGMGVVAEATHIALEERVAIKFLRPDVIADPETCQRFLREAQSAVKLKSEHVARVTDVGTLENGSPYMVMEFLEGVDLDQMISSSGQVSPRLAVDFLLQGCEALAEAHSIGIVHRDVKPSNFFVTWRTDGSPLVKILDFGISKAPIGVDLSLTKTQSVLGTPAYMSPEQMRSARNVDQRSDIWSLGTVLYELIEGRRPFEAESFSEMCVKVAADPPDPMTVEVPAGLDAVIFRCLEKDPARRYQSVGELVAALVPYARDARESSLRLERINRMIKRPRTRGEEGSSPSIPRPSAGVPLAQASSLRAAAVGPSIANAPAPTPARDPYARRGTTPYGVMPKAPMGGQTPAPQPIAPAVLAVAATPPPVAVTPAPALVTPAPTLDGLSIEQAPTEKMPTAVEPSFPPPAPVRGGRRIGVIVGVALAVVAIVVAAVVVTSGGGGTGDKGGEPDPQTAVDEPKPQPTLQPEAKPAPKPAAVVEEPKPAPEPQPEPQPVAQPQPEPQPQPVAQDPEGPKPDPTPQAGVAIETPVVDVKVEEPRPKKPKKKKRDRKATGGKTEDAFGSRK